MKTALITGGAKGIGRAIGVDLAARGYNVAFCYRSSEGAALETAAAIQAAGAQALAVRSDVSDPAQCEALFARVRDELGAPSALVHCAGPYHRIDLLKETPEGWRSMMAHNLDSLFYCARLAAPSMIERKHGRIVAFGMANADRGLAQPQITAHYIAKSGLITLVRTLAKSLAPHGITANVISPGFVASGSAPEEELQKMVKNIPAGYIGAVEDAVSATRYLLSDDARYVNGTNLILSGGWGI